MKATGIIRKVDEVGRVVVPIELRSLMGIENGDYVEIFTENEQVILKKYQPSCVFCGELNNITQFRGKMVCPECIAALSKLKK
jgi:transcriptional pleiotropic regulator of transition state genes